MPTSMENKRKTPGASGPSSGRKSSPSPQIVKPASSVKRTATSDHSSRRSYLLAEQLFRRGLRPQRFRRGRRGPARRLHGLIGRRLVTVDPEFADLPTLPTHDEIGVEAVV